MGFWAAWHEASFSFPSEWNFRTKESKEKACLTPMNPAFQQLAGREVIMWGLGKKDLNFNANYTKGVTMLLYLSLDVWRANLNSPDLMACYCKSFVQFTVSFKNSTSTALERLVCCSVYSDIWSFENKLFHKYLYLSWILYAILLWYYFTIPTDTLYFWEQGFMCPKLTLNSPLGQGWLNCWSSCLWIRGLGLETHATTPGFSIKTHWKRLSILPYCLSELLQRTV